MTSGGAGLLVDSSIDRSANRQGSAGSIRKEVTGAFQKSTQRWTSAAVSGLMGADENAAPRDPQRQRYRLGTLGREVVVAAIGARVTPANVEDANRLFGRDHLV